MSLSSLYPSLLFALAMTGALLVTTPGCDLSSSDTYTVSGTIVNSTERGVDNAELTFSQGGSAAQTTTTNDSGYYEVSGLDEGEYDVSVSAGGYDATSFTVSVASNTTIPNQTLLGSANVSGTVANATNGEGLANAEVAFTFGGEDADTSRSAADLITTTDSDGNYSINNAPTGNFVCVIRAPGYIPAIVPDVSFEEGENDLGQASSSETLEDGEVRIVLEWGENPSDLDSHLTGPDGSGGRFHVYYSNQEPAGAGANLDVDDVTSYGPETITITDFRSGTYRYSVFNFSNQSDDGAVGIDESPARVTVYDSHGQRASYSPPTAETGDGNTWRVLEIDGGSVTFNDNGGDTFGYYNASGSGDMDTFNKGMNMGPRLKQDRKELFDRPVSPF